MPQLDRILYPVDFSDRSARAAPVVRLMAQKFHSSVTLLHVVEPIPHWLVNADLITGSTSQFELQPLTAQENWVAKRREDLEAWSPCNWDGVSVRRAVEVGDPAAAIVEWVRQQQTNLIMMPTHGHGVFRRRLLGSVTAKVLHDAECPIWTDAHTGDIDPARDPSFRRILCAVDGEESSVAVMRWAAGFAAAVGAQPHLVHVMPAASHIPGEPDDPFRLYVLDLGREHIQELQNRAGTNWEATVMGGEVGRSVAAVAVDRKADLVLIGRTPPSRGLGRLRTHAQSIIRQVPCGVISI